MQESPIELNEDYEYELLLADEESSFDSDEISIWHWRRIFYRVLTTSSLLFSPLLCYIFYPYIIGVRDDILDELNADNKPWANILFTLFAIFFVICYTYGNPP